jgi:5-methylthioadenosine/S-adenosylhomocysteine deaminase
MTPFYDVYATLVYAASARDVRHSIIDGRLVMQNGTILTLDSIDVREHVRTLSRRIAGVVAQGIN